MPAGGEGAARGFYAGVLGMLEMAKPDALAGRGGVRFAAGAARVHLGAEDGFVPASKAHPALGVASLEAAKARLEAFGVAWRADVHLPGLRRGYVDDPFGNRVELREAT